MMDSVGPARGQADNRGGSHEAAPLIGTPCAAPIMARGATATPRRGRRYECSLDPSSSISPRHPTVNPRASPTCGRSPDTTPRGDLQKRRHLSANAPDPWRPGSSAGCAALQAPGSAPAMGARGRTTPWSQSGGNRPCQQARPDRLGRLVQGHSVRLPEPEPLQLMEPEIPTPATRSENR